MHLEHATPGVDVRRTAKQAATLLLVAALLVPLVAGAVSMTAAGQPDTQRADLYVEQPHYIDGDVEAQNSDGTPVYVASGETLELHPQNFASEDVVSYDVTTPNASLSYNDATGAYTFTPEATGTYDVHWVVEETVEQTNGNTTTTTTRQQRYDAQIRVDGGLNLVHQEAGSMEDQRVAAENWREFNSTIHHQGLVGAAGTEPAVEEMIRWYHLRKNPTEALTGGVVAYLIMGVTSTAILVWVVFFGGHVRIVQTLRRRLHIFEAVEAEEGAAKEALAELDRQRNQRTTQNMDWQDLPGFDDHIAKAFRETFGETVHDGTVEYLAAMLPGNLIQDRLHAMGHDGWVAHVDRAATDGGTAASSGGDAPSRIVSADLVRREDVDGDIEDHDDIVDLATADSKTVAKVRDALDSWDLSELRVFSLPDADYDAGDLDVTYDSMDLDAVTERVRADMRHFEDKEAFGEYLQEFLESIEDSPVCDDQGRVDGIRYTMTHFLKHAQVLDDRFNFPTIRFHREAIERALIDFDPEQEATNAIERIQSGAGGR